MAEVEIMKDHVTFCRDFSSLYTEIKLLTVLSDFQKTVAFEDLVF